MKNAQAIDRKQVEHAAVALSGFVQEVRLKLHLAGMDAQTLWEEELRPELESLEARLRRSLEQGLQAVGEARVQVHLGLMEARERWEEIEPRVAEAVDRFQDAAELRGLFDAARDAVRGATKPERGQ